jgi:hypothetical protein
MFRSELQGGTHRCTHRPRFGAAQSSKSRRSPIEAAKASAKPALRMVLVGWRSWLPLLARVGSVV